MQAEIHLREDYNKIVKECKKLEKHLRLKEKDLLSMSGFGDVEIRTSDSVDGESRESSILQTKMNSEGSQSDTQSDSLIIDGCREESFGSSNESTTNIHQGNPEWNKNSLISSLMETKDSLREMVDSASKRGAEAWRNLVKKSKKKQLRRRTESEPTSKCLEQLSLTSFDLEIACNTCGKKIIESKQRVLDGKLNDSSMDNIECLTCSQNRETNGDDPELWNIGYPEPLKPRSRSVSSTNPETGERYDETKKDSVDAPTFFIVNGEDLDNRKSSASALESAYGVGAVTSLSSSFLFTFT